MPSFDISHGIAGEVWNRSDWSPQTRPAQPIEAEQSRRRRFIDSLDLPQEMLDCIDIPWELVGCRNDTHRYLDALCHVCPYREFRSADPARFANIMNLHQYMFRRNFDLQDILVWFGRCASCNTPHWAYNDTLDTRTTY